MEPFRLHALVDNRQSAPLGGGEPPIIAMGAALVNAIFDASGARAAVAHDARACKGRIG
jgi:CO/xanthine dehydrogenase Mo-binding subunit